MGKRHTLTEGGARPDVLMRRLASRVCAISLQRCGSRWAMVDATQTRVDEVASMESMLIGVMPTDALTFASISVGVLALSIVAT